MKVFVSLAAAVFFLAPTAFAAERCAGSAAAAWAEGWTIEAFADGATCDAAVATLVIRNVVGDPVFYTAQPTSQTMVLAGKANAGELAAGLKEWVDPKSGMVQTSDQLPAWKAGAEAPGEAGAEFPFMPTDGLTQADYEKLRALKAPTFCYVQGMESLSCMVLEKDGVLTDAGIQTFPG